MKIQKRVYCVEKKKLTSVYDTDEKSSKIKTRAYGRISS